MACTEWHWHRLQNKIAKKCLHEWISSAVLHVYIMYAAYCIKSLEQVASKCSLHSDTFARWKWIQMSCGVFAQRPCCVCQTTLENSIPSSHQPGGLQHSVSLKRYSRFMPQGLGEHLLHFRTTEPPLLCCEHSGDDWRLPGAGPWLWLSLVNNGRELLRGTTSLCSLQPVEAASWSGMEWNRNDHAVVNKWAFGGCEQSYFTKGTQRTLWTENEATVIMHLLHNVLIVASLHQHLRVYFANTLICSQYLPVRYSLFPVKMDQLANSIQMYKDLPLWRPWNSFCFNFEERLISKEDVNKNIWMPPNLFPPIRAVLISYDWPWILSESVMYSAVPQPTRSTLLLFIRM